MITHFTVGFPSTPEMEILEASSIASGMTFRRLPRGVPEMKIDFMSKYRLLSEALREHAIGGSEVILFTDAYDVIIIDKSRKIEAKFRSMAVDILFNGEKSLWPLTDQRHIDVFNDFFARGGGEAPFLNSGCYIGYVWAIRQMLSFCICSAEQTGESDDQALAQIFMREMSLTAALKVDVDRHRKLFGTTANSHDDFVSNCGDVVLKQTGASVSILHMNGNRNSLDFIRFWGELYLQSKSHLYDLRLVRLGERLLCVDPVLRKLYLSSVTNRETVICLRPCPRDVVLLTLEGFFVTFFVDGSCNADAITINRWERLDMAKGVDFHGNEILRDVELTDNDVAKQLVLEHLPLDFIRNYELSRLCHKIKLQYPNISR